VAIEYPDILGDLVDAKQRWEVDGVQYVVDLHPLSIAPGQVSMLSVFLQSALDASIDFQVSVDLPKRPVGLSVAETLTKVTLRAGEAGELRIPILATPEMPAGSYAVRLDLRGKPAGRAARIRPQKAKGRMPALPIRDFVGLEIAPIVSLGHIAKMNARPNVKLTIAGAPEPPAEVELRPDFVEIWQSTGLDLQAKATREFSDRRVHIVKPLTRSVIFAAMLNESRQRFMESGVQLQMGEAICISKILTRTVELFLSDERLEDALYVPIFKRLLTADVPFDSSIWLLMKFGYEHILNLAIALSFGLLEDYRRAQIWPIEEQRAARKFITGQLAAKQTLPLDLVYAPLVLAGVLVSNLISIEGEDVPASVQAIIQAKSIRMAELAGEDDQIVDLLDELLLARSA
jgi:hypothetical protein